MSVNRWNPQVCQCVLGPHIDHEEDSDGPYVYFTDYAALLASHKELVEALRLLLETHCCDSGEADYEPEWEGDHTVCADCKPANAALARASQLTGQ